MKRSSPRPSRRRAVISPETSGVNAWIDSSRRVPPMSAFFSMTLWTMRSTGPNWATVIPPTSAPPEASRRTARFFSGSRTTAGPKAGAGTTARLPSLNVTSNLMSRGIARPSEVPTRSRVLSRVTRRVTGSFERNRSDGGAIQARHRDGRRSRPPFERDELEAAGSRDRVGDLPVLVHPDGVSGGRTGAGGRGGVASGEGRGGRLEQRKDFRGDDEKDGEDARDDDDAAHNHEPRRPAVGQDAALRAGAADHKRAGGGCRPARREGVGVDGHVTGSSPALPSRSRRGSGSSRP